MMMHPPNVGCHARVRWLAALRTTVAPPPPPLLYRSASVPGRGHGQQCQLAVDAGCRVQMWWAAAVRHPEEEHNKEGTGWLAVAWHAFSWNGTRHLQQRHVRLPLVGTL